MKLTVGLPGPLRRHEYPGLWEDFFQRLGVNVVFSRPTNKTIFDTGIRMCTGDVCLPLKVLHGHVLSLRDRADIVFVPRYVYPAPMEAACPKFCALPDILRHNLPGMPVREATVDLNRGLAFTLSTLDELARFMGAGVRCVRAAFVEALTRPEAPWYNSLMSESIGLNREHKRVSLGGSPGASSVDCVGGSPGASSVDCVGGSPGASPAIGLVGHTYLTGDDFMTMNLRAKIAGPGYQVVTGDDISRDLKRRCCDPFRERPFWGVGVDLLGTARTLLNSDNVRGLIYVTSFACGIDSVVLELLERQNYKNRTKPSMRLCLDEHTGESGLDTRLEAFMETIK